MAAGERVLHPDEAALLVVAQLVGVEQVDLLVAAAEEQQRGAHRHALVAQRGPVLEEAAERREPGARPDHDHRRVRVLRRPERDARGADEGEDGAVLRQRRQVARAGPGERAAAGSGRPAQHADGDAARVRIGQRRGGDGVVAGPQRRQHVEELRERQRARRERLEQVEQRPVGGVHPVAVGVAARQLLERGLLLRVVGVAGEGGDVVAARDVLQLHAGCRAPRAGEWARRSAGGCARRCSG